jgi:hypothetical protein
MNSKAGKTWILYPLMGPPIGLMVLIVTTGVWPSGAFVGEIFIFYLIGGIQALFVGICAGVYGAWRGNVPIWVPICGAMIPAVALLLLNFEKWQLSDPLADPPWFALAIHLVPAIVVWSIIRIAWGPGRTWTPKTE